MPRGIITPTLYTYINAHRSLFPDSITQPVIVNYFLIGRSIIARVSTSGVRMGAINKFANADLWVWVCLILTHL